MEKSLYKSCFCILLVILAATTVSSRSGDIIPKASDDSRFRFTFAVDSDLGNLQRHYFADSTFEFYRTVLVAVPIGAEVLLNSAVGTERVNLTSNDNSKLNRRTSDRPIAEIAGRRTVRGRELVAINLFPVSSGEFFRSIEIDLSFVGATRIEGTVEVDPAFDNLFGAVVANYEQAKSWASGSRESQAATGTEAGAVFGEGQWFKVSISRTGLCRISGAELEAAGLDLSDLASDSIHLFNGGGLMLPKENSVARPEFTEVSLMIEDGGDGNFDVSDNLYFFAEAADRWIYRDGFAPRFETNQFTDHNVYWLAASSALGTSGLRMTQVDASPQGFATDTISRFRHRVHVEQNNMIRRRKNGDITDYWTWYWTNETSLRMSVPTPGAMLPGDTANVLLKGRTASIGGSSGYMDMTVNGVVGLDKSCDGAIGFSCRYRTVSLVDGLSEVNLVLWGNTVADPFFDFLEVDYMSMLSPSSERIDALLEGQTGTSLVEIVDGFSSDPIVFDLSDRLHPTILAGYQRSGNIIRFDMEITSPGVNRVFATTPSRAFTPTSITSANPVNLIDADVQADMIIVVHNGLIGAMQEYIDYRTAQGHTIKTVSVADIMDNFSAGMYDPTAIRDYLKFAYENYQSPAPAIVLFVGDGSYDFRDHLGVGTVNICPPYLHPTSFQTYVSDDHFVYFGRYGILDGDTSYVGDPLDRGYDMMTARWPVRTANEIGAITRKIKSYESVSALGEWRTKLVSIADDELGQYSNETIHVIQAEELADQCIPGEFNVSKIYLWDYPLVNQTRPDVNDAIVRQINEGALIANYVGHGNPELWAHEHVFTRSGDLPRLDNANRLPLIFAASCAIGFFDDPMREGMAEDLLAMPDNGAVGVISASRQVYSQNNAEYNREVFRALFGEDDLTIVQATYLAKLLRQYPVNTLPPIPVNNDRAYHFFGDPLMKLGRPTAEVVFDIWPSQLTALRTDSVVGHIVTADGTPVLEDGILQLAVYDTEREKTYRVANTAPVDYAMTGPAIFQGSATVIGGEFKVRFVPAADITYGGQGARISAYAVLTTTDALGAVDSISISDSLEVIADSTGPQIDYSFAGRTDFRSGDIVGLDDLMQITLTDPTGINLTGSLGHGITLQVDDVAEQARDLTALFEYDLDDFTAGSIELPLEDLEAGLHRFKIKAWDNANNSSSVEFSAEVAENGSLAIVDLLNHPNPMSSSTRFSFQLTQPVEQLVLEIFTIAGRKLKSFSRYGLNRDYYDDIVWYGDDFQGGRVATGVYLYKATAVPSGEGESVESFGKLIVINN